MRQTRKKLTRRQKKMRKILKSRQTRRLNTILEQGPSNTSKSNNSWEKISNNEFNDWVVPHKPKKRSTSLKN